MQTLRTSLLAVVVLALSPLTVHAQQVQTGTTLYVDHTEEDQSFVQSNQLCLDAATDTSGNIDAKCRDIAALRVNADTISTTLPAWVPKGRHELTWRVVWKAPFTGASAQSNALPVVVVGGPPERLRTTVTVAAAPATRVVAAPAAAAPKK